MKLIRIFFLLLISPAVYTQPFQCGTSTVKDIDGNVYHTVLIGNQCWMKENMRTTRYPNGDPIGISSPTETNFYINQLGLIQVYVNSSMGQTIKIRMFDLQGRILYQKDSYPIQGTNLLKFHIGLTGLFILEVGTKRYKVFGDGKGGIHLESQIVKPELKMTGDCSIFTDSSKCFFDYNNDPEISKEYGKLYSFRAALNINSSNPGTKNHQGICPDGWHVANDSDWMRLEVSAGMTLNEVTDFGKYRGVVALKLRAIGKTYWYNAYGTDDFGFSARGSGFYFCQHENECNFYDLTYSTTWWTYNNWYVMLRQISAIDVGIYRGNYYTYKVGTAYSVRCIKDQGYP